MRTILSRLLTVLMCLLAFVGIGQAKTHKTKKATSAAARKRGQKAMDASRVREIQAALIRERFLQGQPNGIWDQRSKDAMQKYQGANGWQTKMIPDSRALIKLGLGPDRANLINPETAATFIPGGGSVTAQR